MDGSLLPALAIERLVTSLHDLLEPETELDGAPQPETKPYFPLGLKCSILHDTASGLAFLHGQRSSLPPRPQPAYNSSALNVLVNSAGLRVVTMTKTPGAAIYMSPEVLEAKSEEEESSSRYDAAVDIFSLGVIAIFTVSQTFPCNLLHPTYRDDRRRLVKVYSQLPENHPH